MDDEAKARISRLKTYCKRKGLCLDESGEVGAKELSSALQEKQVKGSYPYCRDILAMQHRSFGAAKAREIERALGITYLYLDGGADWPFTGVDVEKVQSLTYGNLMRLEGAIIEAAHRLGLDIGQAELPAPRPVGEYSEAGKKLKADVQAKKERFAQKSVREVKLTERQ